MAITIVVGYSGSGKSTMLRERFMTKYDPKKIICYALLQQDMKGYRFEGNFKKFVKIAISETDIMCVVDEASTALPQEQPDADTKDEFERNLLVWLLNARKFNHMVFFVVHAIEEIPHWIVKYCDYMLRFATYEMLQYQIPRFKSFPSIVKSLTEYPIVPQWEYDEIKIRVR